MLIDASDRLTAAAKANRRIAPAGEWLLDNFYLIEEQIRTAKRHLPKGYSRELPRLRNGPSAGLPRVYDIALETISHGDGRVDPESLNSFVASYQTVAALTLGELWAIPIMLRLALIENLRRVAARVLPAARPESRRNLGRRDDGDGRDRSEEPHSGRGRYGALEPADVERVRGRARAPASGPESRRWRCRSPGWRSGSPKRSDHRAAGADGEPAAGRRPGLHQQQHRESPIPGRDGLARDSSSR